MNWKDKEIKTLTNQELIDASFDLNQIQQNYEVKVSKAAERHKNVKFEINPAFIQLQEEVKTELQKRGL